MKKLVILIIGSLILVGCSEFKVITKASLRELSSDAISIDKGRYQPKAAEPEKQEETKPVLAKADEEKGKELKKAGPQRKELWVTKR